MRVLIIEQKCDDGHYLNYVQYLVQAFAPLGCEIVVAVPQFSAGIRHNSRCICRHINRISGWNLSNLAITEQACGG